MNANLLLNRARKELERAETQAATDSKASHLAWQVARAAKVKLKQARKLYRLTRKAARKAEDKSEESAEALESARAKVEKLEKKIKKEKKKPARKVPRSKARKKASRKPKPARSKGGLPRRRAKSKPGKTARAATPGVSPVKSRKTAKPPIRTAHRAKATPPKAAIRKAAVPAAIIAPESRPVPAAGGEPGDINPPPAPEAKAPSSDDGTPANTLNQAGVP